MTRLCDKQIADVVYKFQPERAGLKNIPEGFKVIYDRKNKELLNQRPNFLGSLFGNGGNLAYYYVFKTKIPFNTSNISLSWKDGKTDFSLDFSGSFSLEIRDEKDAKNLVRAIHNEHGPAEGLQLVIERAIHDTIRDNLKMLSPNSSSTDALVEDPLWKFIHDESAEGLGYAVSERAKFSLGLAYFEIGLRLLNLPPEDISIEDYVTEFRLQDIERNLSLKTTADLRLNRLQNVKKSGYHNEDDIKSYICECIKLAVRDHIQGKTFYAFVEHFDTEPKSIYNATVIKQLIESDISNKANAIGYRLNIFHTLPNIQSLQLKDGLRLEYPSTDATAEIKAKYAFRTKDLSAPVNIYLALNIVAEDYSKLKRLIRPGDENLLLEIEKLVINACRDVIIRVPRKDFNLNFSEPQQIILGGSTPNNLPENEKSVERRLIEALDTAFGRYGLKASVIHITQAKTEDAGRYDGLLGKGTMFKLIITPQADIGKGDIVEYDGVFEVLALVENGWEAFERKDNGFRRISLERSGVRMANFLKDRGASVWQEEFEYEWKNQCLNEQLNDIGKRITDVLEGKLSKISNLANRGRTLKQDNEVFSIVYELAKRLIADEFGLEITIRSLKRLDSETDIASRDVGRLQLESEKTALIKKLQHDLDRQLVSNKNVIDRMKEDDKILPPETERSTHLKNLSDASSLKSLSETALDDTPLSEEFKLAERKPPAQVAKSDEP